jgi:hypothetical protein
MVYVYVLEYLWYYHRPSAPDQLCTWNVNLIFFACGAPYVDHAWLALPENDPLTGTCALNRIHSKLLCAPPGPPTHTRAAIVDWASTMGYGSTMRFASLPRAQACVPRLPDMANTGAALTGNYALTRIHSKLLCAHPGPPTHTRATFVEWPLRIESSTTAPQAARARKHACPDSPLGNHMRGTC